MFGKGYVGTYQKTIRGMDTSLPTFVKGKKRILIVEDENTIASIYCDKFSREGFAVSYAVDGEEGLRMASEQKPDVILLDIILPRVNGFDVLQKLKANPMTMLIPVIMWTNLSQPEDAQKARSLGAVDYLVKVNNLPSEVVERVKEYTRAVAK